MPDAPRQIRLAAGDYYMHGQDHKLRRAGLPGYICRVALRLEDGLDVDRLRRRVETSPVLDWLARVRLTRPLPVFPPLWRTSSQPGPIFFEHNHQNGNGHEPGCCRRWSWNATCTPAGGRRWRSTWCGTPTGPGTWSFPGTMR